MERQAYTYDAWGNHTVTWHNSYSTNFNASYNPFRYRGYFYDTDTGLYYLQSRYYNPQWGRFLNVDAYISTGTGLLGYNMYAYCGNNPVMRIDSGGRMWELVPALNPRNHVFTFGEGMGGGAAGSIQTRLTPSYSESSAYRTWSVRSRTAAYDASLGGYCAGGGGSSYGSSGQYSVPRAVTVTDDMAVTNTSPKESYNYSGIKTPAYSAKRGWNHDTITIAISQGAKGQSINRTNNELCTVYCYNGITNKYVVIENKSRAIVQLSKFDDAGWIPDNDIIWDP